MSPKHQNNPLAYDLDAVVQIMGQRWYDLAGARLFVTGGTGFVGRWLLETFAWANRVLGLGAHAVVLSRDPVAFAARAPHLTEDPSITVIAGDVRSFEAPSGPFTHVIHAATDSSVSQHPHDPLRMVDTIVTGTRNVLEFARANGSPRMVYVSSGAVYGRSRSSATLCAEDDRSAPLVTDSTIEYDEAKRMAEALCALYAREHALPVSIARGFTFVGPHLPLDQHFAVGNFIRDALNGDPIRVSGDGLAVRSYLYTADLAVWLWTILLRGEMGRPYNVGSDEVISIADLAHLVSEVVNPASAVAVGQMPVQGAPLNFMAPDTTRARTELGLTATVSLAEAIRRTADWNRMETAASVALQNPATVTPAVSSSRAVSPSDTDVPEPVNSGDPTRSGELMPLRAPLDADALSTWAAIDAIVFDFDGVMTDNRVAVFQDGREAVLCDRSDGLGIGRLRALGLPMLVLSTEVNPVVAARCSKLKLECLQGIDVKEEALAAWLAERDYDPARTIYVGNDINDLGCLRLVGCPVAVGDAYDEVKAIARLILKRPGGHGAVRELADVIYGLLNGRKRDERS